MAQSILLLNKTLLMGLPLLWWLVPLSALTALAAAYFLFRSVMGKTKAPPR
jgi:Na+-driven multidrug efflux pump